MEASMKADVGAEKGLAVQLDKLSSILTYTDEVIDRLDSETMPIRRHSQDIPEVAFNEKAMPMAVDSSSTYVQIVAGFIARLDASNAKIQNIINEMEL